MAKRIVLMMMVVMLAGLFFAMDVTAAQKWYTCKVVMAGPGWGKTFVCLSDTASSPAFTNQWFTVPAESEKQILATALTSMNSGMQVYVCTDLSLGGYPPIYVFYLIR